MPVEGLAPRTIGMVSRWAGHPPPRRRWLFARGCGANGRGQRSSARVALRPWLPTYRISRTQRGEVHDKESAFGVSALLGASLRAISIK